MLHSVIEDLKNRIKPVGATEAQIREGFRTLGSRYLQSDFHPTYIQRRLGPRGFLVAIADRYVFREELIRGLDAEALETLATQLEASLKSAYEDRQQLIAELLALNALPPESIQERHRAVDNYLSSISGNRGEHFEVVSYAILQEYFRSLGFELKRFSTVHANDGGMDFIAESAIYQVTVDESASKVKRDLRKLPGVKRVMVRHTVAQAFQKELGDEVLETLDLRDLLDHFLAWLLSRDQKRNQAKHLQAVIGVALEQFGRENVAEMKEE